MIKQAHQLKIGDRILLTGRGVRTIASVAVMDDPLVPNSSTYKFTFKEASPLVMESTATFKFEVVDTLLTTDDTQPIRIPQSIAEFYASQFLLK